MTPLEEQLDRFFDDAVVEKLRNALAAHAFDGTECHGVVSAELRRLEHEIAASNIRHAILSQYRDTIPVDAAVEIILRQIEDLKP